MPSQGDAASLGRSLRPRGPVKLWLRQRCDQTTTVVTISGELDLLTAPRLADHFDRFVRTGDGDVVADLSETVFIDSAGLYVLLNAQRRLARQARGFAVIAPPGPVRRVIELSRVQERLGLVSNVYELPDSAPPIN